MSSSSYINVFSIAFWSGIAMMGLGITEVIGGQTEGGISHIVQGLGLIGLRRAIGNR